MKKIFKFSALIMALLMAASFIGCTQPDATEAPTETPTETATVTDAPTETPTEAPMDKITVSEGSPLCGFENGTDAFVMFDLSQYDFAVPPTELFTGNPADSGNALKIKVDSNPAYAAQLLLIDPTDCGNSLGFDAAAEYDYLRFWVSNVSSSDVSIAVLVVDNSNKTGTLGPDGAFLMDKDGNPEDCFPTDLAGVNHHNGTGDTHISIPAGFTGWAYYSIAAEDQIPWWEGTTFTDDEMTSITQIRLDIRYEYADIADELILDSFCLANQE